jgi:hypothetical protein
MRYIAFDGGPVRRQDAAFCFSVAKINSEETSYQSRESEELGNEYMFLLWRI